MLCYGFKQVPLLFLGVGVVMKTLFGRTSINKKPPNVTHKM
jgi:hypothetical protein